MDLFLRFKSWILNLLFPFSLHLNIPDQYFLAVQSLEDYKELLIHFFDDGTINVGRLEVLKCFTEMLCLRLSPKVASDIRNHFENVIGIV